ncbi:MAG: FixH family protein [Saprospiraceae bacterium]|nr:FixH family protein [Saprospiraceae bacterium]
MKFNWGTGIALVYGLFALSMIAMVVRSRQHDPGLVSKDYYNLDLNYQAHLEKKQNAARLSAGPQVQYNAAEQVIYLSFPADLGPAAGTVKCFRAAVVKDDFVVDIQTGPDGQMRIPAAALNKGLWHFEMDWQAQGVPYFNEAVVSITPGTVGSITH